MFFRKNKQVADDSLLDLQDDLFINLPSKTVLVGTIQTERAVRIDCNFKGDIVTTGRIVVSKSARIEGNIKCSTALIAGQVKGNIVALETLVLNVPAHIRGNILTRNIHIESGVIIDGMYKIMEEIK